MKIQLHHLASSLLLIMAALTLSGCGSAVSETKTLEEVRAESKEMDAEKLTAIIQDYKDAIAAKQKDIEAVAAKLKEIPVADMLGDEAKKIKAELSALEDSTSALTERMAVYVEALNQK